MYVYMNIICIHMCIYIDMYAALLRDHRPQGSDTCRVSTVYRYVYAYR